MRKILTILFVLLLSCSFMVAQERTGDIYGKVTDEDGNPIPGVKVTLTGSLTAPMTSITSAEGNYRFLSLSPAKDYTVKAELEGFKAAIKENIIVVVGANVEVNLTMEMGAIEEEVTVTAVTPVVDQKKTQVGQNVTREVLQSLPSARDPWVVLEQAPGVMVDRSNVGGSESGQQAVYQGKGGGSNQWSMDGITITDPAAVASPSYYDFDAFEEMNITTGGQDVTVQTGGIQMNLVSRRGGNRVNLGGRFYFTDKKFQDDNLTDELIAEGITRTNVVRNVKDYGFNMGGPFIKDKAWYWMSFGVQNIKSTNLFGTDDDTLLQNIAAKINIQPIPENRFEAFVHIGQKEKWGRSAGYSFPDGWHQTGRYHFGSPIIKLQDEHMFGDNLFVSAVFAFSDAGFNLIPMADEDRETLVRIDALNGIYRDSYWAAVYERPMTNIKFLATYYNDSLFGASHEFKLGGEYFDRNQDYLWSSSGNAYLVYNYGPYSSLDFTGDGIPDTNYDYSYFEFFRGNQGSQKIQAYAAYLSDTVTIGNLNLLLGIRYDLQQPVIPPYTIDAALLDNPVWKDNVSPAASAAMDEALPGLKIDEIKPDVNWSVISPRLGLTWDVFGDGKTIGKISFAQYGEFMGTSQTGYFTPLGTGGWMGFYWFDDPSLPGNGNGDGIIDPNELFWRSGRWASYYEPIQAFDASGNWLVDPWDAYGYMWGGYDIDNPQQTGDPTYTVDDDWNSMRTTEYIVTVERELLTDFGIGIDFTYRKLDNYMWTLDYYPDTGIKESKDFYVQAGTVPSDIGGYDAGEGAGRPYYLLKEGVEYTDYNWRGPRPDFYRDYYGATLRAHKRLSNKWMFNGSFTLQMQKQHYGENGYLDPTDLWARDNTIFAHTLGSTSGKIDAHIFSRWMLKLSGLYQLPWDVNISFTFNAKEGNIVPFTVDIRDLDSPNPNDTTTTVYLEEYGKLRLPTFYKLDMRLEKMLTAGEYGRIYIMFDMFNVLNSNIMERRYNNHLGTYTMQSGELAEEATNFMAYQTLNPRIFRLGVRFQF